MWNKMKKHANNSFREIEEGAGDVNEKGLVSTFENFPNIFAIFLSSLSLSLSLLLSDEGSSKAFKNQTRAVVE
jgi:hypothetical protein